MKHRKSNPRSYRGRHRTPPTHTASKVGTVVLGATVLSLSATESAAADPPGGWDPLISCESGNRNVEHGGDPGGESTASGFFQFVNGTWRAFGGTEFAPRAIQASKAEQTIVANRAFAANGLRDWEASRSCWEPKYKAQGQTKVTSKSAPRLAKERTGQVKRTVVVKRGDTLSGLFQSQWPKVFEANRQVIGSNPNLIRPGQTLRIPV